MAQRPRSRTLRLFFPGPGYRLAGVEPPSMRPRSRYVRLRWPRRPRRRLAGLVLGLLLVSCRSTLDPASGDPRLDLQHPDPRVRIDAAEQAVRQSRMDLCGLLVENLGDRDGAVRLFSSIALRKLTGQDFGFKAHGTLLERQAGIEEWTTWLESEGLLARDLDFPETPPLEPPPPSGALPVDSNAATDADGDENPPPSGVDPAIPLPEVPLDSAAGNPVENASPREKKSAATADDRLVGTTSKPARS